MNTNIDCACGAKVCDKETPICSSWSSMMSRGTDCTASPVPVIISDS